MRVLFVQQMPCLRSWKMAHALKECGHSVDFASPDPAPYRPYGLNPAEAYDQIAQVANPLQIVSLAEKYDVVHVHNEPDEFTRYVLAAGVPVVHDCHDLMSLRSDQYDPVDEAIANRRADGRVYVSQYQRECAEERYGTAGKPTVLVRNLPTKRMIDAERKPKLSAKDGQVHLVYEGGLHAHPSLHRNLGPLFIGLAGEGVIVHVYGMGNLEAYRWIEYATGSRVQVHRPVPTLDIIAEVSQYDVGLCAFTPNDRNRRHLDTALPNKLFEYLHAGLPVVCPRVREMAQFIAERPHMGTIADDAKDVATGAKKMAGMKIEADPAWVMEEEVKGLIGMYQEIVA
ncbi:MAG: glycosyltransferase [Candidatus Nanopelagicales bacterium]